MRTLRNVSVFVALVTLAGCVEGGEGAEEGLGSESAALTTEDGLAEAR